MMTHETLFRVIGLHMLGYFGKGKRGLNAARKLHECGLLTYWAGSASALYALKKNS